MNVVIEGWTYTAVEAEGVVTALVALRNPDQLPAGIIGLYATVQGDGTWGVKAWTDSSYEEIVLYLAGLLDQPIWDVAEALIELPLDWGVLEDPEMVGIAPAPFGSGLLEGDPLGPAVAGSSDPMTVLEVLELLNYPAVSKVPVAGTAGGTSEDDACVQISVGEWFDLLRSSFESELAMQGTLYVAFDTEVSQWNCCYPFFVQFTTSTPWACGSWSLESVGNPPQLGECIYTYRRLATRSQTRTRIRRHIDCSVTTCIWGRSCAAWQQATCTAAANPTISGGFTCTGVPPCTIIAPLPCTPTSEWECSNWYPPCP